MRGLLIINPRSGADGGTEDLARAAADRGLAVHVLRAGDDATGLARASDAEVLGIAGGDGSLASVATVSLETARPFVCVPFGTRNHFARDVELPEDPVDALRAFEGEERRIDVGRVAGRTFLNNVSLGLYAQLVHRREHHRRRREALARLRAAWATARRRDRTRFTVDGETIAARVVLVANNAYRLDPFSLGARESLEEGRLHLYVAHGVLRRSWEERIGDRFDVDAGGSGVRAAIDGEPQELATPVRFTIEPRALRLLVPRRDGG